MICKNRRKMPIAGDFGFHNSTVGFFYKSYSSYRPSSSRATPVGERLYGRSNSVNKKRSRSGMSHSDIMGALEWL